MSGAVWWADSGAGVGLGHVARACAVGEELLRGGLPVLVLTPDERGAEYGRGQRVEVRTAAGFAEALATRGERGWPAVVVDSYRVRPDEYSAARAASPLLVVFDDDGEGVPVCDVVVNGAPGAEALGYTRRPDTEYLLGAEYFPLRKAFRGAGRKSIGRDVERVVITLGGEDVHGLLPAVAKVARGAYPAASITAIRGSAPAGADSGGVDCEVLVAPPDYPMLVRHADVMVCGAGQTLIETAAAGTPAAALLLGADQRHQHAAVLAAGACADGGSWELAPAERERVLRNALEELRQPSRRSEISGRGQRLVDGGGAGRIAAVMARRARALQ